MFKKIGWGMPINNFVIQGHTTAPAPIRQRLPAKFVIKFNSTGTLPASCDNESSFVLDLFYEMHKVFSLVMVDNITIIQMGAYIEFVRKVQDFARNILREVFQEAKTLRYLAHSFMDMLRKVKSAV